MVPPLFYTKNWHADLEFACKFCFLVVHVRVSIAPHIYSFHQNIPLYKVCFEDQCDCHMFPLTTHIFRGKIRWLCNTMTTDSETKYIWLLISLIRLKTSKLLIFPDLELIKCPKETWICDFMMKVVNNKHRLVCKYSRSWHSYAWRSPGGRKFANYNLSVLIINYLHHKLTSAQRKHFIELLGMWMTVTV